MSSITTNLELFKYDTVTDKDEKFNITTALNNNFDKIDTATGKLSDLTTNAKTNLVAAINEINAETTPSTTITYGESVEPLTNVNILSKEDFDNSETIDTGELNCVAYTATPLDFVNATAVTANTESTFSKDGVFFVNSAEISTINLQYKTGMTRTLYATSLTVFKGQKIKSSVAGNFFAFEGQ